MRILALDTATEACSVALLSRVRVDARGGRDHRTLRGTGQVACTADSRHGRGSARRGADAAGDSRCHRRQHRARLIHRGENQRGGGAGTRLRRESSHRAGHDPGSPGPAGGAERRRVRPGLSRRPHERGVLGMLRGRFRPWRGADRRCCGRSAGLGASCPRDARAGALAAVSLPIRDWLRCRVWNSIRRTAGRLPDARDFARLGALRFALGEACDAAEVRPLYLRDKVALTEAERRSPPPLTGPEAAPERCHGTVTCRSM